MIKTFRSSSDCPSLPWGFGWLIGLLSATGKARRMCMGGRVICWALENHVHVLPTCFTTTMAWHCACNGLASATARMNCCQPGIGTLGNDKAHTPADLLQRSGAVGAEAGEAAMAVLPCCTTSAAPRGSPVMQATQDTQGVAQTSEGECL